MRLNGSMRLGIVMSAVWMVLTTTFLWLQDSKRVDGYAKALSIQQARCKLENVERRSSKQPEQACVSDQDIRGRLQQRQARVCSDYHRGWLAGRRVDSRQRHLGCRFVDPE